MALNPHYSNESANAGADAECALANSGYLRIYDGSQPAGVDTPVSDQVLLAELRFGATAFGAAVAGVATANAITADSSANATGNAAWYRVLKSDGASPLWDGSVGTSGANLNMATVAIQAGARVEVSAFTFTRTK